MNNDGFSLKNPAIIPTCKFGDGEFHALGNILLGMDHERNNFFSFNIQPIRQGCFCSLFIWKFNAFELNVSNPLKQINLFSKAGKISANANNFEVTFIELKDEPLKYLALGRSLSYDSFLYVSLIFADEKSNHFQFSTNDSKFEFNPSVSILFNPLSISVNCLSSVKFITILEASNGETEQVKTFQFDVENYLKTRLQCNIKNLEYYETSIIGKVEKDSSFIIFIGFYFYNEKNQKWTVAFFLMSVPVDGKTMRQIHVESICFEKRPRGDVMEDMLKQWKDELALAAREKIDPRINFMTNKNRPGVDTDFARLIRIPEMNLIIADERNGIIKF